MSSMYLRDLLRRYKSQREYLDIARGRDVSGEEKVVAAEHVIWCADDLARVLEREIKSEEAGMNEQAHVEGGH